MSFHFPKAYADQVARLRVPCGFLFLLAFMWFARPTARSILWGLPLSLAGMALRAWAAGHLEKNQRLAETGPYAWVRNPLYLGSLAVTAGVVAGARSWGLGIFFAAAFVLIYLPVIELEEQHLRQLFPSFDAYARRVPLLLPNGRHRPADPRPFLWSNYRRNQEWKAAAGYLFAVAWLAARAWFAPSP